MSSETERRRAAAKRAKEYRRRKKAKRLLGLAADDLTPADEDAIARMVVPGNKLALTHGARDPERVAALAQQIMRALLDDPGTEDYLRKPMMRHEVIAWAHAEAQVHLMRAWLDSEGISSAMTELTTTTETETGDGEGTVRRQSASRKVSSLMSELHKAEVRAANRRIQLGMTPLARGRLGKDLASTQFDLARFFAEIDAKEQADRAAKTQGEPAGEQTS